MGLANLDLLTVGVVVAATGALGFTVYFSDRGSATNRIFLGFSVVTALWGIVNYMSYQFSNPQLTLWLLRGVLFFAILQAFCLYEFFSTFPSRERPRSRRHTYILIPLVAAVAIVTLTPLAFAGIAGGVAAGQVAIVEKGPGLVLFAIVAIGLVIRALWALIHTMRKSTGETREAIIVILWGTAATFALIIFFNLILATAFVNPRYIPFGALFTFPFIAAASYAILREHLFNVKVAATAVLVFVLAVASFLDVIFSDTLPQVVLRVSVFSLVLIFGISLVRGVLREVEQRERIEQLAQELEETNERQESLIHFVSHEVKGFLARYMGTFASFSEGDFGALPDGAKDLSCRMLAQSREDARMVTDILQASNLKKGTITFKKEPFDLKMLVEKRFAALKPAAEAKGLAMILAVDEASAPYMILGDEAQFGDHVLQNLIQNSINYTPSGSVEVSLGKENGRTVFAVKDTGVGITDEDKARLFTEGGHGKDSIKVNAHSTGYGLYIAKQVTEAHGGTIRAESDGAGKGSRFVVELPAQDAA
jgi:signal transduction histidine kinase